MLLLGTLRPGDAKKLASGRGDADIRTGNNKCWTQGEGGGATWYRDKLQKHPLPSNRGTPCSFLREIARIFVLRGTEEWRLDLCKGRKTNGAIIGCALPYWRVPTGHCPFCCQCRRRFCPEFRGRFHEEICLDPHLQTLFFFPGDPSLVALRRAPVAGGRNFNLMNTIQKRKMTCYVIIEKCDVFPAKIHRELLSHKNIYRTNSNTRNEL